MWAMSTPENPDLHRVVRGLITVQLDGRPKGDGLVSQVQTLMVAVLAA
jgi:hypothetical protein